MRATITFSDDVAAAVEKLQRERGLGLSETVNDLIRAGLMAEQPSRVFRQKTHDLGASIDFSNIGETL